MKRLSCAILMVSAALLVVSCARPKFHPLAAPPSQSWATSYGGACWDEMPSIQQTKDGGYIVTGTVDSFIPGNSDFWLLKLNSEGTVSWQKRYGGANEDFANWSEQTSDGGYIVAGYTESFGAGDSDLWLIKLNTDGTMSWQKTYGGTRNDGAISVQQTSDGGFIVAGGTNSFGAAGSDFWVLKLKSDSTVSWQKRYGGTMWDSASSIQQTSDGGYIVAGTTESFGAGNFDFWVFKLNSDGTVAWQKAYGGKNWDYGRSIQQTSDGGYILAGGTESFGAGSYDFWVLKLNSDGTVSWQKTYGGAGQDSADSIRQTTDGGYIVAGRTDSFDAGNLQFWLLKLRSDGAIAWQRRYGGPNIEYANSIQQTRGDGYIVTGVTWSFGAAGKDFWVLKLDSDGTISFNSASGASAKDTNAVPVDTNCTVVDTTATVADTDATVTDTNATVTDTNATITQQAR